MDANIWWIAAGLLVGAELFTGTFYLLMLALGAAAGALASHLGFGMAGQQIIAATIATIGLGGVRLWRQRKNQTSPTPQADHNVILDIGQTVDVTAWDANGLAQVTYRGSQWQAKLSPPQSMASSGQHRIVAVEGSVLMLEKA